MHKSRSRSWLLKKLFWSWRRLRAVGYPEFEPSKWGPDNDVQYDNNCYNYACNIRGAYSQPGRASGETFQRFNCEDVNRAVVSDGLTPVQCNTTCRKKCHQVALVMWPDKAFHWYRRDRDGYWSHKLGDMPPTNLDHKGNPIVDPRTADRGHYTIFCGCYCVCKDRVSIK